MTQAPTYAPVQRTVVVNAPPDRAFAVFTAGFAGWWPSTHHIGKADMAHCAIEPQVGGRWFERGVDGSECLWGHVLAWEPPTRVVLSWMTNGQWAHDPDPAKASEVEVTFAPAGDGRTRVTLEHRHFERHQDGGLLAEGVGGEGGWNNILAAYVAQVG